MMTQILELMHLSMSSDGITCEGLPCNVAFFGASISEDYYAIATIWACFSELLRVPAVKACWSDPSFEG